MMTDTQREAYLQWLDTVPKCNKEELLKSLGRGESFTADGFVAGYQAALAHSQQWIDVRDRMPEIETPVLTLLGKEIMQGKINLIGIWSIFNGRNGIEITDKNKVTHWMPLPQPPITNRKDE